VRVLLTVIMDTALPNLDQEIAIGRYVAKEGVISHDELLELLRCYKNERDEGNTICLSELMIQQQLISEKEATDLQAIIHSSMRDLIEGYHIVCKVGQGGMGSVYKAQQHSMNRRVALKILSSRYVNDQQFVKRFFREVKASGTLNHPNIVHGYDSGICGGRHYLAMEYVDGNTVDVILKQVGRYSEIEVLKIIQAVARALEHAHSQTATWRRIVGLDRGLC